MSNILTERYESILNSIPGGIAVFELSAGGTSVFVNEACADLFGSRRAVLGKDFFSHIFADEMKKVSGAFDELAGGKANRLEMTFRILHGDGGYRYLKSVFSVASRENGLCVVVAACDDVTDKYQEKILYERQMQQLQVLPPAVIGTALFDADEWKVVRLTYKEPITDVGDRSMNAINLSAANAVVDDEDVRMYFLSLTSRSVRERWLSGQTEIVLEYRRTLTNGSKIWVRDETHLMKDPDNGHLMMFVSIRDIDREKKRLDELSKAAESDSMTGLYNHDAAIGRMTRYLQAEGAAGFHAMFMVDLDYFKDVNDHFGHQKGDEVIIRVADILRRSFRGSDILGRIGGDEFLALMKNVPDGRIVQKKAEELIEALHFTLAAEGKSLTVSGSIGVALFRADGKSFEQLFSESDKALYEAKTAGRDRFRLYAPPTDKKDGTAEGPDAVQLRALLENLDCCVILADVGEEISVKYVSPSLFTTMRRTRSELGGGGERVLSVAVPEDSPLLTEKIMATARTGRLLDHVYRVNTGEGGIAWRHISGTRLPEGGEGVHQLIFVLRDITELKLAEQQLKMAEERYRSAVKQSAVMMWEVDLKSRTLRYSDGISGRAGGSEVVTVIPESGVRLDFIKPGCEDELKRLQRNICAGNDAEDYIMCLLDKNGFEIMTRSSFILLRDEKNAPYYAIGITLPLEKGEER